MPETLEFPCPYCGSPNSSFVDLSEGAHQEWISDCEICCRPMIVHIDLVDGEIDSYTVRKENE